MLRNLALLTLLASPLVARADGPQDNLPDKVRRIPPPGIEVPLANRQELQAGLAQLNKEIETLRETARDRPRLLDLLPDVQVYHAAVRTALVHHEFFNLKELPVAKKLLRQGLDRAQQLREGQAPWTTATGLVVRGYVSRIDGSVQPYGLVVPASYQSGSPHRYRLDVWCHGRGETLSELNFINVRQTSPGEFVPPHAFVLHPYGRYCNANKFAGEIDLFEALEHVGKHYPIDPDRLVMRGFSMGGAACWQFAAHYPSHWVAAAPGAGFSETPDFLKVFQNETLQPTWYEQKLWHLYDCTDYALNFFNCPVAAYSGEKDRQKQAADMMARAFEAEGMKLVHIIGPGTGHSYHPQAREEINRRIDQVAARGRNPVPERVLFTTWTLRYHRSYWVSLEGLEKHWERARVDAEIARDPRAGTATRARIVRVDTQNVSALTLSFPPGHCPLDNHRPPIVLLDGQELRAAPVLSDRSWIAHFVKQKGRWEAVESPSGSEVRKRPGLQGPIDDAFMDRFLMVRPTGKPLNEKVGAWAAAEQAHAIEHWRRQFRGDARVKDDSAITEDDIAANNLVLWGDPASNQVLARIAGKLPIRWNADGVRVGGDTFAAGHHLPVLIYPNPLNPRRYVVVNSGFTYREYDYLNNARQVPKLPDYAVVDVNVPVTSRLPGGIVAAGFFDERWELPGRPSK